MNKIDKIYIATGPRDAHLTRICIGSIRYFYPDILIEILPGDRLQWGLKNELAKLDRIQISKNVSGDYGWGFVKIEPLLFGDNGERFLIMDADTVMVGPILDLITDSNWDFIVDDEFISEDHMKHYYFDWDKLAGMGHRVISGLRSFNGGQWFGSSGKFERKDFEKWVIFDYPRSLQFPDCFFGGEQGVVSLVVLEKEFEKTINIKRVTMMRWPADNTDDIILDDVVSRVSKPLILHWAGLKENRIKRMFRSDILLFFENYYYHISSANRFTRIIHRFQYRYHLTLYRIFLKVKIKFFCL